MSVPLALVAEDEPLMLERLLDALRQVWPELAIVTAADGDAALDVFERRRPDVAFLDIRMPGPNGLEVASRIAGACHVVFVTAYDQHAIAAFEAGAVDYLLKPVDPERLAVTVARLKTRLSTPPADLSSLFESLARMPGAREPLRWIRAAVGREVRLIATADVLYFQADTKYTRVVLASGEALIKTPLKDLARELDPQVFWQVHRSAIVNVHAVAGILREDAERQFVLFKGRAERLPVSRQFQHLFRQM